MEFLPMSGTGTDGSSPVDRAPYVAGGDPTAVTKSSPSPQQDISGCRSHWVRDPRATQYSRVFPFCIRGCECERCHMSPFESCSEQIIFCLLGIDFRLLFCRRLKLPHPIVSTTARLGFRL